MGKQVTSKDFIEKAIKIHGYKYNYDYVNYVSHRMSIIINCYKHGNFKQKPSDHLSGNGCSDCANRPKINTAKFIELASKLHNNKYNYRFTKYVLMHKHVIIICNNHDKKYVFKQTPANHMSGHGCDLCGGSKPISNNINGFINKANIVHNYKYDYSKVIINNNKTKIIIICNNHKKPNFFEQRTDHHLNGHGCSKCTNHKSKPEIQWLDSLNIKEANRQVPLPILSKRIKVDGYDPETNTVYEFHGDYWHGNPNVFNHNDMNKSVKKTFKELYEKTINRENIIKDAGYKLVVMWESDWKKYEKIL